MSLVEWWGRWFVGVRWVGVVLRLSAVATITTNDHVCEMVRDHRHVVGSRSEAENPFRNWLHPMRVISLHHHKFEVRAVCSKLGVCRGLQCSRSITSWAPFFRNNTSSCPTYKSNIPLEAPLREYSKCAIRPTNFHYPN